MPDYLKPVKSLWNLANTPVVPEAPVRAMQDVIDPGPSLERGPWEARLRGFGAGALEGLRQQTTPLNIAAVAGATMPKTVGRAVEGLSGMASKLGKIDPFRYQAPPAGSLTGETLDELYKLAGPNVPAQLQKWRLPGRLPGKVEDLGESGRLITEAYEQAGPNIPPILRQAPSTSTWGTPKPQSLPPRMNDEVQALMEALAKIGVK